MRTPALLALPALLLAPVAHAEEPRPSTPAAAVTPAAATSAPAQEPPATTSAAASEPGEAATTEPSATATATTATTTDAAPAHEAPAHAAPAHAGSTLARRSPTAGPQLEGPRDGIPDCRATAAVCWEGDTFAIWPRLRLRSGYEFVQPDSQVLTIGQNDGFFFDQNRIGFDGAYKDDLRFRLILDVVTVLPGAAQNDPVQNIGAAVRDAWVAWLPSDWFYVSVGQQFMPSDVEGSTTIAGLPFARRSVATSGVRPGHGFAVQGLSPTRQLGLVVGSTERARAGDVAFEYQLAVSNGNGQNVSGNDNKLPAAYARAGVGYVTDDLTVRLGVGGRFNPRTVGTLPNLFTETDSLGFADLSLAAFGVHVVAQGIYRQTSFNTVTPSGGPGDTGFGATAWIQLDHPFGLDLAGVKPAYRFSYYEPSSTFPDDQLLESTLGVRWDIPFDDVPLTLFVDGTLLTETGEGVRDLDNARVTALLQLDF